MKKPDLNEIAKFEKAIEKKYGKSAIQNPRNNWDEEKEKKYLEDLKKFYSLDQNEINSKQIVQKDGFVLKIKKGKTQSNRHCPVCGQYSFRASDYLYMAKFNCCEKCYIDFVEGREDRWKTGWRPKK